MFRYRKIKKVQVLSDVLFLVANFFVNLLQLVLVN